MGGSQKTITLRPMSVEELAKELDVPINMLIVSLLKRGVVASRNQVLDESVVESAATLYGVSVQQGEQADYFEEMQELSTSETGEDARLPVVTVVGHVDHGKTTLLDYIRRAKVASGEAGGITQHVRAYNVNTSYGELVFLDTPGHEAFSLMRVRGIAVADIVILVVAADDGVMPQTKEAIDRAKQAGLPLVVAINKADKVSQERLEQVKSELSRNGVIPEEWGGSTPCVPISALQGTGVDTLLEVVSLQGEMLELQASLQSPAKGYVLESHIAKGRGPVATLILRHGTLRTGDFFCCGSLYGKVNALKAVNGRTVKKVGPSEPVVVSGFDEVPRAGDIFQAVSAAEARRGKRSHKAPTRKLEGFSGQKATGKEVEGEPLDVLVKSNTISSTESLVSALEEVSRKVGVGVNIVDAGVGDVTESDVSLAHDTHATVLGLHVKMEPGGAAQEARRFGVKSHFYTIIYKLLEDVEAWLISRKPVETERKKIGEGVVLKVFDIKKVGVIAGSQITQGHCTRDAYIEAYRGNTKIGEGSLASLQKERKNIKEVKKGHECGLIVQGFSDWQEGDTFVCYRDVPVSA